MLALAVVAMCAAASVLPVIAAIVDPTAAEAQVAPPPRPVPAPAQIAITDTGYEPVSAAVVAGQSVVYTNESSTDQSVTEAEGAFDSGPIAPGGAFTVALDRAGFHNIATAAPAAFTGSITIGRLEIAGPPTDFVRAHLPEIVIPPVTDWDDLPGRGIVTSRTRIKVLFADGATVGQANAALAAAGVTLIGTVPEINEVLVAAEDHGIGDFDATFAAEESLRADPAVAAAALDMAQEQANVPGLTEDVPARTDPFDLDSWRWNDMPRELDGSGQGNGGNWGMEASRFPQAWNVLDPVRRANTIVDTLVLDSAFVTNHPDLPIWVQNLCQGTTCNADTPPTAGEFHGTHVAGTIGASWANPATTASGDPPRVKGVDGANPVVHLYGAPTTNVGGSPPRLPATASRANLVSTAAMDLIFVKSIDGKASGQWPNLRVINMSIGSLTWVRDANKVAIWGDQQGTRRCGPNDNDDGPAATGPCLPDTDDVILKEIQHQGIVASAVAARARANGITLVVSAGNDSNQVCVAGGATKSPTSASSCPGGFDFARQDTRKVHLFGRAAQLMGSGDVNPIIMVGAINIDPAQTAFSNGGADLLAPGDYVQSTAFNGGYALESGTSMAAPHVTGLVGYLLAIDPTLTSAQLRDLLRNTGYAIDTGGGSTPRIDAYNAVMALTTGPRWMLDVNDASPDGNRRVIRSRSGTEKPDLDQGPIIDGAQVRSTGDNVIDMRDFRRYRDAVLAGCADFSHPGQNASTGICPTPDKIDLDAKPAHPKKDLNGDGCVYSPSFCDQYEDAFSRFDFNGDGTLKITGTAQLPLVRDATTGTKPASNLAAGERFTDLELLQLLFDRSTARTEGWRADQLPDLLVSGDVEVHADALFQGGAEHVDVIATYGDGTQAPIQQIAKPGGQVIVTVPVPKAGGVVTVSGIGRTADGTEVNQSFTETTDLKAGSDRRVDLCVATVSAVPNGADLFADGESATTVQLAVSTCGRPLGEGIQIQHELVRRDDSTPAASTLSAPASVTDEDGRATVDVQAGTAPENLSLKVTASVETDPNHPGPEQVTGSVNLDVTARPRVIYKWEQVTDDWESTSSASDAGGSVEVTYRPQTGSPLVIGRSGSLQQAGDGVALTEHVGSNDVPMHLDITYSDGTTAAQDQILRIPPSQRVPDRSGPMSGIITNLWQDDGRQTPFGSWEFSDASMEVDEDTVTVNDFADVGQDTYRYDTSDTPCNNIFCASRPQWDQLVLTGRMQGSAIAYSDDLTKALSFRRLPSGGFSTYQWCSAPKTFTMRGDHAIPELLRYDGTATSRFRFIATVTTDPRKTGEDLVLPVNCVQPVAPVASFSRDVEQPIEGRVVHFLDTSHDDNGDIAAWAWDFGDGTSSTEQDPEHRYDDDGTYQVTLKVTDGSGLSNTTSVDIVVTNGAPQISADDVIVGSGQAAIVPLRLFDPSERDQEYLKLSVTWEDHAGPVYPDVYTAGGAASLNLGVLPDSSRRLILRVADKDGKTAETAITVTVGDASPEEPEPPLEIETTPAPGCAYGVKLDVREQELAELLSGYRIDNDLDPVYASPSLTAAATAQARWLRDNAVFQHEGEGGSTPQSRAAAAGYPAAAVVGENLGRGPRDATGALVIWKMSRPHDANLLDERWNAVGIAAVDSAQGTIWVLVFGNVPECPIGPPDFDPATDAPDPVVVPDEPPIAVVLAAGQAEGPVEPPAASDPTVPTIDPTPTTAPEASARPIDLTPVAPAAGDGSSGAAESPAGEPTDATPPPAATAPGSSPAATAAADGEQPVVAAFTISTTRAATGELVTLTNRSGAVGFVAPGDGRTGERLEPGASTAVDYLDPGTVTPSVTVGSLIAVADLTVSGAPRPPVIAYTGPIAAAFGSRPELTATLATGTGTPVVGRTIEFRLPGRTLTATTDGTGTARAVLVVDLPIGPQVLVVEALPLASGPGATTSATLTVGANAVPVVDAHGPYDVVLGEDLVLDTQGTTDPDGSIASIRWDLDDDGAFDDAADDERIPAAAVAAVVCGGACDPAVVEDLAVQATDNRGGVTIVETQARFIRDFRISLTPASATLNPSGNTSFQVVVSTSSGFTDPVVLTAPSVPPGVRAILQPATVTPGQTALLTLVASAQVEAYDGPFTVRGTSGSLVRENQGTVEVEFGLVPQCYGAADIHVVDAETGEPVEDASVNNTWFTDADGMVRERDLELGSNNSPRLRTFQAIGFDGLHGFARTSQYIGCGVVTQVELRLPRFHFAHAEGRVVVGIPDPDDHTAARAVTPTDQPVPFATASLLGFRESFATDADGRFAFDDVIVPYSGTYRAGAAGYHTEQRSASVTSTGQTELVLALVPTCTASVDTRVRDGATGRPLPGVDVAVFTSSGPGVTDASGRAIATVPLGFRNSATRVSVSVSATLGGHLKRAAAEVTVTDCGSIAQVDLQLEESVENYAAAEGRVTNSVTGEPAAGRTVHLDLPGGPFLVTTTDADGRYRFDRAYIGLDDRVSTDAYVSVDPPDTDDWLPAIATSVRLNKDQTTTKDLTIVPRQFADLDVRVVDAATGDPLAGIEMRGNNDYPNLFTDADGRVSYEHIWTANQPRQFAFFTETPGFLRANGSVVVRPNERMEYVLPMTRTCAPGSIQGVVRDASTNLPLPDANVAASGSAGGGVATTDADGRFVMTKVPVLERRPTSYLVYASKPGYLTATKNVTLFCGGTVTVNLGTPNTGTGSLAGIVTRADTGAPVAGVIVGGEWGAATTTGADGRYSFASVPLDGATTSRDWTVRFVPPYEMALAQVERTATITKNQATTLDVALGGPPPNARPVARSFEVTIPDGQTYLDVFMDATDADGDPLTYRIGAETANMHTNQTWPEAKVIVSINGLTSDEESFTYIASDGSLDSMPATITVRRHVTPPVNRPPNAFVTPVSPVIEGGSVTLDGSKSSDSDGTIVAYEWDFDRDGQYDDASGVTVDFPTPDNGLFYPELRVTDDDGATATSYPGVRVDNAVPVVVAGADEQLGADARLQRAGSFADPGADTWVATVDWGEGAGKQPLALTAKTFALDHTFAAGGTFTVSVEVCDDDRGCGSDTFSVTVAAPPDNQAPTATITGPSTGAEGAPVPVSGATSTDPDGTIAAYEWDLDGDGQYDDATGATAALPAADDGAYTVALRVRDDDGAEATTSRTVTVTNVAPTVEVGADVTVDLGAPFQRTGSFSDPGPDTWVASADWGDGTGVGFVPITGSSIGLEHTYDQAGAFTVVATVCDDDQGCGEDTFVVTVDAPADPLADLAITKAHAGDLFAGADVTYELRVVNDGPDPADDVAVVDTLPTELSFVSAGGVGWVCGRDQQEVTCTRSEPLAPGQASAIDLVATVGVAAPGTVVTNVASVASATTDPDPSDDEASDAGTVEAVLVSADLAVTLAGPTSVDAGQAATWTATVSNDGPDDATDVEVAVTAPASLTGVSVHGSGWTCAGAGPITCHRPSLAAGASATVSIEAIGAGGGASIDDVVGDRLVVRAASAAADPDGSDNEATLDVVVAPPPTTTTTTSTTSTSTTTSSTTTTSTTTTSTTTSSTTSTSTPSSTTTGSSTTTAPSSTAGPTPTTGGSGAAADPSAVSGAATTSTTGSLPVTGASPLVLLVGALVSIVTGAVLVLARRRRA